MDTTFDGTGLNANVVAGGLLIKISSLASPLRPQKLLD
jgi:hypothetical protein